MTFILRYLEAIAIIVGVCVVLVLVLHWLEE